MHKTSTTLPRQGTKCSVTAACPAVVSASGDKAAQEYSPRHADSLLGWRRVDLECTTQTIEEEAAVDFYIDAFVHAGEK